MSDLHAINLFSGSNIVRQQKSHSQPRIILISINPDSTNSFSHASMLSWGIGSLGCFGRAVVSMASREADSLQAMLLVPGLSTVRSMRSSM